MSKKKEYIEVQKGPIICDMPTRKTQTRSQINSEDAMNDRNRKDGMVLKFHTPKR